MGNVCRRRNGNTINNDENEEQEWLLIPTTQQIPNRRFIRTVRVIRKLLRLRRIWGKAGRWLQLPTARHPRNVRTRQVIAHIFATWPTTVLRGTKRIFEHLERVNGRLMYRNRIQ